MAKPAAAQAFVVSWIVPLKCRRVDKASQPNRRVHETLHLCYIAVNTTGEEIANCGGSGHRTADQMQATVADAEDCLSRVSVKQIDEASSADK